MQISSCDQQRRWSLHAGLPHERRLSPRDAQGGIDPDRAEVARTAVFGDGRSIRALAIGADDALYVSNFDPPPGMGKYCTSA